MDRPVLVIGSPRSGRSLVASLLSRAPEFAFVSEPLMIWDAGLGKRPDDRRVAEDATPAICDAIRHGCQRAVEQAGKERYLDDLSYHALRVPFVHRVLPEAKFIHVIRNGDDCVPELLFGWTYKDSLSRAIARRAHHISLRTLPRLALRFLRNYVQSRVSGCRATWGPRVPGLAEFAAAHCPAEIAAYQWCSLVRTAREDLQKLPPAQSLEVRFEDLIQSPAAQMERIAAFCELKDPEPVIRFAVQYIDVNHVFEKKVQPTESQWQTVHALINPLQQLLGYVAPHT